MLITALRNYRLHVTGGQGILKLKNCVALENYLTIQATVISDSGEANIVLSNIAASSNDLDVTFFVQKSTDPRNEDKYAPYSCIIDVWIGVSDTPINTLDVGNSYLQIENF